MKDTWDTDVWKVIHAYFRDNQNYLSKNQLDSFNAFIDDAIPKSIRQFNPIVLPYVLKDEATSSYLFECRFTVGGSIEVINGVETVLNDGQGIYIGKPIIQEVEKSAEAGVATVTQKTLYPNEARLKNLTYKTEVRADIIMEIITHDEVNSPPMLRTFEKVPLGTFPIMLQSKVCSLHGASGDLLRMMGECEYDQGGYFIIDGKEKVIVAQERQVENKIYVNRDGGEHISFFAEIRSAPERKFQPARVTRLYMYKKPPSYTRKNNFLEDAIRVEIPQLISEVPLFVLFRALGIQSDKEILELIVGDLHTPIGQAMADVLRNSIIEGQTFNSQIDALEYIMTLLTPKMVKPDSSHETRMAYLMDTLRNWFLSHIEDDFVAKANFLGHMTYQLLATRIGMTRTTDRDNYRYKRVDVSGFLVADIFRNLYFRIKNRFMEQCNLAFHKKDATAGSDSNFWKSYAEDPSGRRNYYNFYRFIGKDDSDGYLAIENAMERTIMDEGFMYAFKNCWGLKNMKGGSCKEGVVQDMNRVSYVGYLSHIRRVNTPLNASAKVREPHTLHTSQWGIMCPAETPDGANIGLRKNMAILAKVSSGTNSMVLQRVLFDNGVESILQLDADKHKYVKVFLNERLIGYTRDPVFLFRKLKLLKRNALINVYTSISWQIQENTFKVNTDSGRCIRPVIVVGQDNRLMLTPEWIDRVSRVDSGANWFHLVGGLRLQGQTVPYRDTDPNYYPIPELVNDLDRLEQLAGVIEYIDKDEEDTCLIAMTPRDLEDTRYAYTHCEIHPSLIMSVMAVTIPLLECNQAPRNQFSAGQGKQALGIYATNYRNRMDTKGMILHYPQRSIVKNKLERYMFSDELPNGINAIVAVGCYSGYNQDDSIMFNKSSIERGLFHSSKFRTYGAREEVEKGKILEKICNPDPAITQDMKSGNYRNLDENGIPRVGAKVNENDIIIGKCVETEEIAPDGRHIHIDTSEFIRRSEDGYVDKVYSNVGNDNQRYVKVRVRKQKVPELGDKFCSRHGQKGVCGMVYAKEDMPVSQDGIVPDLIINPQAFPSRMTVAQFTELVMGKVCVNMGLLAELSAFVDVNHENIGDILEKVCGFERYGNEVLYNGQTGEMMNVSFFMGPTFYQRLVQQVADKYQSRDAGSRTAMTHQPVGGRALGGGGRIGEMERDSLLSHGISSFIQEAFMTRSDAYQFVISNKTGMMGVYNKHKQIYRDFINDETTQTVEEGQVVKRVTHSTPGDFSIVEAPYAFKLFLQEVESMGIQPRIITEKFTQQWKTFPDSIKLSADALTRTLEDTSSAAAGYYKKTGSELTLPLRRFHNRIKESMLMGSNSQRNHQLALIDFSVGVGGDLMKWMRAGYHSVVGIDISTGNIEETEAIDGAKKRLRELRNHPGETVAGRANEHTRAWANRADIRFLVGDSSKDMYSLEMTKRHVPEYTKDLEGVIERFPEHSFHAAAMFFSIHYLLRDEDSITTFFKNASSSLHTGGYLLVTTLDGEKVFHRLKNNIRVGHIEGYVRNEVTKKRERVWRIRPAPGLDLSEDFLKGGAYHYNQNVLVEFESIGSEYEESLVYAPHLIAKAKEAGFDLCPIEEVRSQFRGFTYPTGNFDQIYTSYSMMFPEQTELHKLKDPQFSQLKEYSDLHRYFIFKYRPSVFDSTITDYKTCLETRVDWIREPRYPALECPMETVLDRTMLNRRIAEMRALLGNYRRVSSEKTSTMKTLLQYGSERQMMRMVKQLDEKLGSSLHSQLGHASFKATMNYIFDIVKVGIYIRYMNGVLVQFKPMIHLNNELAGSMEWRNWVTEESEAMGTTEAFTRYLRACGILEGSVPYRGTDEENADDVANGTTPCVFLDGDRIRYGEKEIRRLHAMCIAYYDLFRAVPVREDCECIINLLAQPILREQSGASTGVRHLVNPFVHAEWLTQRKLEDRVSVQLSTYTNLLPVLGASTREDYTDIPIPSHSLWLYANQGDHYLPSMCQATATPDDLKKGKGKGKSASASTSAPPAMSSKDPDYVYVVPTRDSQRLPYKETLHVTLGNLKKHGVRAGDASALYALYVAPREAEDMALIEAIRQGAVLIKLHPTGIPTPTVWFEQMWIPYDETKTANENRFANVIYVNDLEQDWVRTMILLRDNESLRKTLYTNLQSLYYTIVNPACMTDYLAYTMRRIADRIQEPYVKTNVNANVFSQAIERRVIPIPKEYIGVLIGAGGRSLERIRNQTNTMIHVEPIAYAHPVHGHMMCDVVVEGGIQDVRYAVETLETISSSTHVYMRVHIHHRDALFQNKKAMVRWLEQKWNVKCVMRLQTEEVLSHLAELGISPKELDQYIVFKILGRGNDPENAKTDCMERLEDLSKGRAVPLLLRGSQRTDVDAPEDPTDLYRYNEASEDDVVPTEQLWVRPDEDLLEARPEGAMVAEEEKAELYPSLAEEPMERKMVYILVPKILQSLIVGYVREHKMTVVEAKQKAETRFQEYIVDLRERLSRVHQQGYYNEYRLIVCDTSFGCMSVQKRQQLFLQDALVAYSYDTSVEESSRSSKGDSKGETKREKTKERLGAKGPVQMIHDCILPNKGFLYNSAVDVLDRRYHHTASHIIFHEPFVIPSDTTIAQYFTTSDEQTIRHFNIFQGSMTRTSRIGILKIPVSLFRNLGGFPNHIWCPHCVDRVMLQRIQKQYDIHEEPMAQYHGYTLFTDAEVAMRHLEDNGHEIKYQYENNAGLFTYTGLRQHGWYELENTDYDSYVTVSPKNFLLPLDDYMGLPNFDGLLLTERKQLRPDWKQALLRHIATFIESRQDVPVRFHERPLSVEISTKQLRNSKQIETMNHVIHSLLILANESLFTIFQRVPTSSEAMQEQLIYRYDDARMIQIVFGVEPLERLTSFFIQDPTQGGELTYRGIDVKVNVERMREIHRAIQTFHTERAGRLSKALGDRVEQLQKSTLVEIMGDQVIYLDREHDTAVWIYENMSGQIVDVPANERLLEMSLVEATNYLKVRDRMSELDAESVHSQTQSQTQSRRSVRSVIRGGGEEISSQDTVLHVSLDTTPLSDDVGSAIISEDLPTGIIDVNLSESLSESNPQNSSEGGNEPHVPLMDLPVDNTSETSETPERIPMNVTVDTANVAGSSSVNNSDVKTIRVRSYRSRPLLDDLENTTVVNEKQDGLEMEPEEDSYEDDYADDYDEDEEVEDGEKDNVDDASERGGSKYQRGGAVKIIKLGSSSPVTVSSVEKHDNDDSDSLEIVSQRD